MNLYKFTPEQLLKAVRDASEIALEIAATKPEAARLIMDAVELAMAEAAVQLCGGDRAAAEKLVGKLLARQRG